mgnify:CR=1 FL=1
MNGSRRVARVSPLGNPSVGRLLSEVSDQLESMDARLLRTVQRAARHARPLRELTADLRDLLEDLHHSYLRLAQLLDRRDLRYTDEVRLRRLLRHHVWLYRRIHLEHFFLCKLQLETTLRALVSQEAFEVYQHLQAVEDLEKLLLRRTDGEIRQAMQEGNTDELWIQELSPGF